MCAIPLTASSLLIIIFLFNVFTNMQWNPPTLEQVSKDMVDHYLSPLSEFEPDLELPTTVREAFN